jgi:FemAB-related protein (PEP-CTERM system-associated)
MWHGVPRSNELIGTAGAIVVKMLDQSCTDKWDDFVLSCADATFFHRSGWKTVMEEVFGHEAYFLYAERDGVVLGVLPLARVRSVVFGHSLCSLPFCVYGGIAATSVDAWAALDDEAQELAKRLNVDYLEYRSQTLSHSDWFHKNLYVTFRRPIFEEDEDNLKAIPRKQRAMVRKSVRAGLICDTGADIEEFFRLYANNSHRHGTPALPRAYFECLIEKFSPHCEVVIVRNPKGRAISGVLAFYHREEVLPYYAGDLPEARELAANDFKYWELMRHARLKGLKIFDYGRSKVGTGSYDFKRNWGFEPIPLPYEYKLYKGHKVPDTNPLNPKYRLFIECWKRMPQGLANMLGPRIVKYLG